METRTAATLPEGNLEIGTAAIALCQLERDWQAAARITEVCILKLWPDNLDAVLLFPEIRHIFESQIAVLQILDHVRNGSGDPEENLRAACSRLIRSAAATHQIRSTVVEEQTGDRGDI